VQVGVRGPQTEAKCSRVTANKSLDASGGSVFHNLIGPAMLE